MLSEGSAGDLRPRLQAMGRLRAGTNMKGWLFTILRNVWFNQLRKQRSGPQMSRSPLGMALPTVSRSHLKMARTMFT
jgi:DNA-directed RNA polymerase specialized sigma24 family protein